MALVPLPEKENMDPADSAAIETWLAAFGHMLHTWQAVANVPGLFSKLFPVSAHADRARPAGPAG